MRLFFYFFILVLGGEPFYHASYINESEWLSGLKNKVNYNIDPRSEITSTCYYLKILC